MALLWADGFDDLATSSGADLKALMDRRYAVTWSSTASLTSASPRLSGWAIESNGTAYIGLLHLNVTNDTLIVGLAIYPESQSTSWTTFLTLNDSGTSGVNFRAMTRTGEIAALRGSTLLGTSSGANIRYQCWHYVEVKVKCHSSQGSVEVRVGGKTVLSLTGINTQAGDHAYHNQVWLHLSGFRLDDFYVADTTGSVNNDFLGNVRVTHLLPDGDEGTNQWTPSGGSNHYALVDEAIENDDTDYLSSSTSGQTELWTYQDLSGVGDIFGVQLVTVCRDTDTPIGSLKTLVKSGTTVSEDTAQIIGNTDYGARTRMVEIDPDTSALWTEAGINGASFGVKVG